MKPFFGFLTRLFDRFIEALAFLAGVLTILMMVGISVDVTCGYVFHRPIMGVLELSEMMLLYITFLGAAWVLREEGHVNMDLILTIFKPRTQAWINAVTSLVCAGICLILFKYGLQVTLGMFRDGVLESGTVQINQGYLLLVIPLGSLPLFLQFLRRTLKFVAMGARSASQPVETR